MNVFFWTLLLLPCSPSPFARPSGDSKGSMLLWPPPPIRMDALAPDLIIRPQLRFDYPNGYSSRLESSPSGYEPGWPLAHKPAAKITFLIPPASSMAYLRFLTAPILFFVFGHPAAASFPIQLSMDRSSLF
ncbi:hypothetical protein C8J56DRAFT_1165636 [Mycena floridula]|nr:hypothetical protein C8J56DRAFT_1165636 [Mycena floridula]